MENQRPYSGLPADTCLDTDLLAVVEDDHRVLVVFADGSRRAITRQGEPITSFANGWTAEFLYAGSGGLFILHLRHSDGRTGSWFLDSRLDIIPKDFDDLPEEIKTAGKLSLEESLRRLFHFVFIGVESWTANPADFLKLHDHLLHHVLRLRLRDIAAESIDIPLDTLPNDEITLQPTRSGSFIAIRLQRIRSLLNRNVIDLAKDIIETGKLAVESIVDGEILETSISICISNFVLAYRFIDERNNIPFLLITSTHVCKSVAVYFPLSNECIVLAAAEMAALRSQFPHESIGRGLREHLIQFGPDLVSYLRSPSRKVRCLFWHRHLGHHLWQDLAGLDMLDRWFGTSVMPDIIMMGASRSEMFGPLDMLFPTVRHRVDRSVEDAANLAYSVYRNDLFLISPAGHYITRNLAQRVINFADNAPELDVARDQRDSFRQQGLPIILLGLRVENRTVVNFSSFCVDLLEIIEQETAGRAVVVVDGHNASGKHVFESAGQNEAHSPIMVEREIATELRSRFSRGSIVVLDTIGQSMQTSIFWSAAADFFITPWGAGLAKYRWITNKPGLVLAGRLYQSRGFDLGIYHSSEFMEDPLPMTIIDKEDVEDVDDLSFIIPIDEPQRTNFRVNMTRVRQHVVSLLQKANYSHLPQK